MWMKGHSQELKMSTANPVYGASLWSLMPRAISSSSTFSATTSASCCIHSPNIPAWNQPLSGMSSDYGIKNERSTLMPLVSSRWNPTSEQLEALEEMYRRGIRTPSAQQIQQITAKLTRFGRIQGKNVFYWFQNHKARDRQKKRRQLELLAAKKTSMGTRHESGLSRSDLAIQEPNKLPTPSNCSTPSKYSVSINEAVQLVEECKKDVRTRLDQKELQQEKQIITANSQICLSSYMSPHSSLDKSTTQKALGQENAQPFGALDPTRLLPLKNDDFRNIEIGIRENQTLQLFPIRDSDLSTVEDTHDVSSKGTKFTPNQFFEFLPMKNG